MACALDTYALLTIDDVKSYLDITADDLKRDAFSIYHDKTDSATATTIVVADDTLTTIVTGGTAGTDVYDLTNASYDTLSELVAALLASAESGWVIEQSGRDAIDTADLSSVGSTSIYGSDNTLTLTYIDNFIICDLINISTDVFETLADRRFAQRTRTERHTPKQDGTVQIRDYPINWIDYVSTTSQRAVKIRCSSSTAAFATVSVNRDPIPGSTSEDPTTRLELLIVGGTDNGSNTVALASGTTVAAVVGSINAITGWTATVQTGGNRGNYPSDMLLEAGGLGCLNKDVHLSVPGEPISVFDAEFKYGRFKVAAGTNRVYAKVTGGYATIPDDIKLVALDIIKSIWDSRKTSAGMKRERIGDYEYEKFSAVQANSELAARISSYRNELY